MSYEPTSDPMHPLYARPYPKRPGIAAEALYQVAVAVSGNYGSQLSLLNNGVPVAPDLRAVRCPIAKCDGTVVMTEPLDIAWTSREQPEITTEFWCPECGTSGKLTVAGPS